MPTVKNKYPTRPLEYYTKMKELRRSIVRDTFTARKRGKSVFMGGEGGGHAFYAAFDAEVIPAMPTGREMRDINWVTQLNQAAESRGFGKDCCSTLRIALGAHFLGTYGLDATTGKHLRPDVIFNMILCQGQIKSHQLHAEYLGIPNVNVELPPLIQSMEVNKKHFINQCHRAVEKLEKALGKKCDDEKLIDGVKRELRTRVNMARIALLQKSVPAPLKQRHLGSLMAFQLRGVTHRADVADFFGLALEEVKERVKEGIAAYENEDFRLFHEGSLPWYPKIGELLRYPEKKGGVYIGSLNNFGLGGCFIIDDQGHWEVPEVSWENGHEIKNRDDAFEALAEATLQYSPFSNLFQRSELRMTAARDWNIDGVVFALDRGCVGITSGLLESALTVKEAGIRATTYETSATYPPDFDEKSYQQLIDAFLETLRTQ
ncbi:MAG: 2-hydroxyacyl-CoA dehydratase family protein [Thermodesulfobacteriota bacterium]|nr:2-hydroxyacyl-CoA dehydratase family protein [Thermodesulfobacteriota bacterium]